MRPFILVAIAVLALSGCANQFAAGNEAFERGNWKKAIFHFDHVAGTNQKRTAARELTARAYFKWGKELYEAGQARKAIDN
jgi:alkyl sulfatase BDS1-like metallo-beta-lactamase superfamily hydrolase